MAKYNFTVEDNRPKTEGLDKLELKVTDSGFALIHNGYWIIDASLINENGRFTVSTSSGYEYGEMAHKFAKMEHQNTGRIGFKIS